MSVAAIFSSGRSEICAVQGGHEVFYVARVAATIASDGAEIGASRRERRTRSCVRTSMLSIESIANKGQTR